jgi:streptogramin lyase
MARSLGADPRIGTELAGYRIEALLGRGGMSVVYLAEDLALGRKVALKLMAPQLAEDRGFRERFRRESRLAASLDHPNVIPIYEAGEAEGLLFIAMRYVDGTDLRSVLVSEGALAPARALAILSQVAEALDAAHARRLVHRDVKPSNVLLAGPAEREHVYLADFGLTKTVSDGEELQSLQLSGTADYLSPEQIAESSSGASSDVYSLGCVLYECLTGRVPYPREQELAVLWAHVDEAPPRPSEVLPQLPRALDDVIARALAKEPDDRYRSAGELVESARLAFPQEGGSGRRRLILVGAILALLVAATVVALVVRGSGDGSADGPTLDLAEGALQRVDPNTNKLVATIRVGGTPVGVAAGAGAVWLIDAGRNSLVRVDPATGGITIQGSGTGTLAAVETSPAFPSHVGTGADGPLGAVLARISARDLSTVETSLLPNLPGRPGDPAPALVSAVSAVAATASSGWFADAAAGTITRLSREGPFPRLSIDTGGMPLDLASTRNEVWVAQRDVSRGRQRGSLVRLDDRGGVTARVPLAFTPSALAADAEGVWVADPKGRRVWLVEPRSGRATPIPVGGRPVDVALGVGSAWVVMGGQGKLARVDVQTRRVVATIEIGANPTALAVGEDGVWVAVGGGTPLSPDSFPTQYRRERYEIESIRPGRPGARCAEELAVADCLVVGVARLTAGGRSSGFVRVAVRERRRPGSGPVECLGKTYDGPIMSDVRGDAGTGRLEVPGWGTIALDLERNVLVVPNVPDKPALCLAQSGNWIGVRGPIRGEAGTFTTRGPGRVLVFTS